MTFTTTADNTRHSGAAPLIGLNRHRLAVDGKGVTTLVAFHGCPLRCAYCLNRCCQEPDGVLRTMTTDELLREVMTDDLYFQATGGGICFGGGEPCLRSDFICEFADKMPSEWKITIETSLNVDNKLVKPLFPKVSQWIVDVKDMNPQIYSRYTGSDNHRVVENLEWLKRQETEDGSIVLRLPLIPGYNTAEDIAKSRQRLQQMGFDVFDEFEYIVR